MIMKELPKITTVYSPDAAGWAEICEAVWVGFIESGSLGWCDEILYDHNRWDLKDGQSVVSDNFPVTLHEEGETDSWFVGFAFDIIHRGIDRLDDTRKQQAMTDIGLLDANDYDYIVQLGLFGEEVYC